MRTAIEIATDISKAKSLLQGYGCINVAGRTQDELAIIEVIGMKLRQDIWQLEKEQREWIEQPKVTP